MAIFQVIYIDFLRLLDCELPAALCHWCGTWKGDKICGGCKKSRYCSEKHQVFPNHLIILEISWASHVCVKSTPLSCPIIQPLVWSLPIFGHTHDPLSTSNTIKYWLAWTPTKQALHHIPLATRSYFGLTIFVTLSQALHWRSGHKNDCLQIINSSEASSSVLPAVGKGNNVWRLIMLLRS